MASFPSVVNECHVFVEENGPLVSPSKGFFLRVHMEFPREPTRSTQCHNSRPNLEDQLQHFEHFVDLLEPKSHRDHGDQQQQLQQQQDGNGSGREE